MKSHITSHCCQNRSEGRNPISRAFVPFGQTLQHPLIWRLSLYFEPRTTQMPFYARNAVARLRWVEHELCESSLGDAGVGQ